MGSKKHKKESKKKKHRSRSRSPLDGEERERKRHKKHKDRKKDRSPDVEEVPVDSHLVQKSRSRSASAERAEREQERDRRLREARTHKEDRTRSNEHSREPESRQESRPRRAEETREQTREAPSLSGGAQDSLSVEETNKLRAKLGLKPLEVHEKPADDGKLKDDLGEFYHKPAANISEQKKGEKVRQKLEERREKRKVEQKLQSTRTLGEESDEEDALAWVKKSREIETAKRQAAKRAAMLDEMDEVFGVSALVAEDARETRDASYTPNHLKGLRVAHDIDALADERDVILTLADKEVLAEDSEDVLVNVNIVDEERYKKNIVERKKAKTGYKAYDDEADLEAAALGAQKSVLAKYDDEIDKEREARERGFHIGDDHAVDTKKLRNFLRQEMLQGGPNKRLESLAMPELQVASDYMNEYEIEAKFKKPKKKMKGMRKKAKHEPIDVDDYDAGTAPLETDDTEVVPSASLVQDEEEVEVDSELQAALARARRLAFAKDGKTVKVEDILQRVKEEPLQEEDEASIVVDATAEFCRTLGDIPTYGQAGNRDHLAEIMDFDREDLEPEPEPSSSNTGTWSRVDVDSEKPGDLATAAGGSLGGPGGLDAEPLASGGLAGALRLALSKGYLRGAGGAPARAPPPPSGGYCIEDKQAGEDDKYVRRERGPHGPLSEFREKAHFRPHIKLEYADDEGRPLCPKEAFRYLSHKFHGKGPGKNKQEKRIKKMVQEGLMKKMSSTDTPLGTLQMLQDKQRETQSPYIVLSGAKREPNN